MTVAKQAIVKFIGEQVLAEHGSEELQTLIDAMPDESSEAASEFCDALELGNWFYEAMLTNEIDISDVMIDLAEERRLEEEEESKHRWEIEQDMRRATGWPH